MRIDMNTPISELYHSDDEIYHWKYIRKERSKTSGKWIYYYPNGTNQIQGDNQYLYTDRRTGRFYGKKGGNEYGTYKSGKDTLVLKKSNKVFSNRSTVTVSTSTVMNGKRYVGTKTTTVVNVGKLERFINSAKGWLSDRFDREKEW
jgi:hypothetical protein